MNEQIFTGPPLPKRVRAAFAFLEYVQNRLQPCCHPAGELTKQEAAAEATALRTLIQYLSGEQDFTDPPEPAPAESAKIQSESTPQEARAS